MKVPFNRPVLLGRELEYIADAVARMHISGDGHYTTLASRRLEEIIGARRVLLTTSCTHAIEMAAMLLDVKSGDEVIMPSFTFVSTANAFVLRGARPVFIDIRPDTLNLDERLIEAAITPRTRAIVVVHYAGVACEMDTIAEIAARHGIPIVEDNAHGLFGAYKNRPLGSFGTFATQSFHETKNVICGEGGALVLNDPSHVDRAEIIREKGTNRKRFFRGIVDKYSWVEPGSSYLPSDMLAAFLYGQLECSDNSQRRRAHIWHRYHSALGSWAQRRGIGQPTIPEECQQAYHLYYLLLPTIEERDRLIRYLRQAAIGAVFHYVPLHVSEFGTRLGYRPGDFRVTESASDRLVRLPMFNDMSDAEQDRVISQLIAFTNRREHVISADAK